MVDLDRERAFYDSQYAQFLQLPDHALRTNRGVLESNLDNPAHPFYERRRLYRAAMRALDTSPVLGTRVLDYGCGTADFGLWLATEGADVTLLDLSAAAIELGHRRALASGVMVRGIAADAGQLSTLRDGEFDLVFASAALHHTLKYPGAVVELARVMRPGARLVLCETWGANPLLNGARRLRARISGEQEEQGEGIILCRGELRALDASFTDLRVDTLSLLAMGKRLLRGRFVHAWARRVMRGLESVDALLLRVAPPLREWCGEAVITARRK